MAKRIKGKRLLAHNPETSRKNPNSSQLVKSTCSVMCMAEVCDPRKSLPALGS